MKTVQKEPERLQRKRFVKKMGFKSGVKAVMDYESENRNCGEVICAG